MWVCVCVCLPVCINSPHAKFTFIYYGSLLQPRPLATPLCLCQLCAFVWLWPQYVANNLEIPYTLPYTVYIYIYSVCIYVSVYRRKSYVIIKVLMLLRVRFEGQFAGRSSAPLPCHTLAIYHSAYIIYFTCFRFLTHVCSWYMCIFLKDCLLLGKQF